MKLLLDENLPHAVRPLLMPTHEVFTVTHLGWSGLENGALLAKAAENAFDAVITVDQGVEYEQNLAKLPLSVVVLRAKTNKIDDIRPLIPEIMSALSAISGRSLIKVG
jgi:predicted nuclease of predicted toxin-antitoxin system